MQLQANLPDTFETELKKAVSEAVQEGLNGASLDNGKEWISKGECADFLNISRSTLDQWIKKHGFPCTQVAGVYRFSKQQIRTWMLDHQMNK